MVANPIDLVQRILNLLMAQVRQAEPELGSNCSGKNCHSCQQPHFEKLLNIVEQQKVLTLILPAFPAKSANREKTISSKPDLGEVISLKHLNELCKSMDNYYPHGIKLVICSDGRVFNDLVLVRDKDVDLYQLGIKNIIKQQKLSFITIFSLDDVYPNQSYAQMREKLMEVYAESFSSLQNRILIEKQARYQFNGIHRFVFEDQLVLNDHLSKNQIRSLAKQTAYEVIRRSNAWSRLLSNYFPTAIRLSIHPQPCGSDKLGIQFLPNSNRWATPWHNVLLKRGNSWQLIKRIEAERLGAKLNHDHYVLEGF